MIVYHKDLLTLVTKAGNVGYKRGFGATDWVGRGGSSRRQTASSVVIFSLDLLTIRKI